MDLQVGFLPAAALTGGALSAHAEHDDLARLHGTDDCGRRAGDQRARDSGQCD
jgi:hypothetical protein